MMPLTEPQIEKFQELYRQHFGEEISEDDAREKGERLVELIRLIRKPANRQASDPTN